MVASASLAGMTTGRFHSSIGSVVGSGADGSMNVGSRSGCARRSHSEALPTVSTTRWVRGDEAGLSTR